MKHSSPGLGRSARIFALASCVLLGALANAADNTAPLKAQAKPMTALQYQRQWGPAVGTTIESLAAVDQQGQLRELSGLAGPNGLLLFLVRSADW